VNLGPVFTQAKASGIHEVLVLTPDHSGSWADLDEDQVGLVMAALRDRSRPTPACPASATARAS
jgi:UDPglucose--hexose-1-phosphate uridylyltransferase